MPVQTRTASTAIALAVLLAGCAGSPGGADRVDRAEHFNLDPVLTVEDREAAREARREADASDTEREPDESEDDIRPVGLQSDDGPSLSIEPSPIEQRQEQELGEGLEGDPIRLEVNNLPLPAFIHEVFGEKLGLSYSLPPALSDREDLVTLKLSDPLPPEQLFRTARSVLADYGVAVTQDEGVWRFNPSEEVSTSGRPLLVTGRARPDVPVSHRPVFQVIELSVASNNAVRGLVRDLFQGQDVQVSEDAMRNAVILKGPADQVADAVEAVRFFDRPVLKGRHTRLIRPEYRDIRPLSSALEDVLSAQGFATGSATGRSGSVILLPMEELEVLVVLANEQQTLDHVENWARKLDQDYQREIETGTFTYEVQNTSASNLADLITQLYAGDDGDRREREESEDDNGDNRGSGSSESRRIAGGRLVVDEQRSVLIYRGGGQQWMELKETLKDLDRQVPSVLLEVLLAEVTLNDSRGFGVEWLAREGVNDLDGSFGTLDGLGIGGRGFSATLDSAGQTRAILNAFYDSDRAVIRSSPQIMVKSGETARIEVGNEIPVLTSSRRGDTQTEGDTDVLQQFQFRQTGVDLSVEPVVQASGLVDIRINQSLSETQDTGSGGDFLPTILNRSVDTSLTLRDGGSVVLGGLISRTSSQGEQGVPFLGRIPFLGQLFRTDSDTTSTTELIVMVVPYVVRNDSEAQTLSERLRERVQQASDEVPQPQGLMNDQEL